MQTELAARRRLLLLTYRRFLDADRDWTLAQYRAKSFCPGTAFRPVTPIGSPGSRIRRLYERRQHAIQQLLAARQTLERAKARLALQRRTQAPRRYLIASSA